MGQKNSRFLHILILAAIAVVISGCSNQASLVKRRKLADIYHTAGTSSLRRGEFALAIQNIKKSLEQDPARAEAWNNLGIAYFSKDKPQEAEEAFRKAIQLDSKLYDAKFNLAIMWMRSGKTDLAIRSFLALIEDPEFPKGYEANFHLGKIFLDLGDSKKALGYFTKATDSNPNFCPAWIEVGEIQWKNNDPGASRDALEKGTTGLCYNYIEGHYRLGTVAVRMKNLSLAREKFSEVVKRFPKSDWAKKSKKKLALLRGDF